MRSALFVRALVALATALLLGGTLLATPAASAPSTPAERTFTEVSARGYGCKLNKCWGAISFNPVAQRGGWTQKGNYATKKAAMSSAFRHCKYRNPGSRRFCVWPGKRDTFIQGGTVAVAWLVRNGQVVQWTVGKAFGHKSAERRARRKLDGAGTRHSGYFETPNRKG